MSLLALKRARGLLAYCSKGRSRASKTAWVSSSWESPASPAPATARWRAERRRPISTKSLKCPAWREASWRLSVKERILRASSRGPSASFRPEMAERLRIVVAELRPSEPKEPSLVKSERRVMA